MYKKFFVNNSCHLKPLMLCKIEFFSSVNELKLSKYFCLKKTTKKLS